jgi:2C-methyl-D-erythritol 2,4-cyclodiphosphate synthase
MQQTKKTLCWVRVWRRQYGNDHSEDADVVQHAQYLRAGLE